MLQKIKGIERQRLIDSGCWVFYSGPRLKYREPWHFNFSRDQARLKAQHAIFIPSKDELEAMKIFMEYANE